MSDAINILMCTLAFYLSYIMFKDASCTDQIRSWETDGQSGALYKIQLSITIFTQAFADPNVAPDGSSVHNHIPYV